MVRTILIPTDLTPTTQEAIVLVGKMFPGAQVHLLHVVQPQEVFTAPTMYGSGAFVSGFDLQTGQDSRMKEELEAIAVANGCSSEVVFGSPADEIIEASSRIGADLIAMVTQGKQGLIRILLGSVSEGVSRRSKVPVLIIPKAQEPYQPIDLET